MRRMALQRASAGEKKFFDTQLTSTAVPTAGVVNPNLVIIPQGDGESERIGRKIVVTNVLVHGSINTDTTDEGQQVRIMLVQDKQANGAVFNTGQVLAQLSYQAFREMENIERFVVLYDKTITMTAGNFDGTDQKRQSKRFVINKKVNIPILY